jgi:pimeloyl-ACP methyl ester carboxylesterase
MPNAIELDDVTLVYEERDSGSERSDRAVVFVHGLGGSSYSWWAQLAACEARGHRAIAYDQRGAGRSTKPEGPYSVELWAEDLERVLDRLGVDGAILIGHSVGSMVVEHTAVRLGDRVLGVAMLGGALQWRPEAGPVFERRVELAREGRMDEIAHTVAQTGLSERCRESNPALLGLFLELIASNDPDAYADCSAATAAARMIEPGRVACPALAACGELDPVTPPAFAEAIAAEMPAGRTAVVEGAAHWCQLEAPADVNGLLLRFLDEIAT